MSRNFNLNSCAALCIGCFLLQHFLLGVKFVLSHVIPDVPQWVQDEMARQQYKAQLALRVCALNKALVNS